MHGHCGWRVVRRIGEQADLAARVGPGDAPDRDVCSLRLDRGQHAGNAKGRVKVGLTAEAVARGGLLKRVQVGIEQGAIERLLHGFGLSLLVLGIVRTGTIGWGSPQTIVTVAAGIILIGLFLAIEGRFASAPLMPLRIFRSRTLTAANLIVTILKLRAPGM